MKPYQTYTIKVSLRYSEPAVWRRFVFPSKPTLSKLAQVLDIVMGWGEPEPYWFESAERIISYRASASHQAQDDLILGSVIQKIGDRLEYHRGFGEDWGHDLRLEAVTMVGDLGIWSGSVGQRLLPPQT